MDLYIRQRVFAWGDKYDITDDQETPVFRVEGEVFTFGAKLHLYDLKGQELYYVEQELFHFMPRYTVYKGRMAIASVRKNFTLFGHSLTVESGYGNFEIEGSVFGWDFRIGGRIPKINLADQYRCSRSSTAFMGAGKERWYTGVANTSRSAASSSA